MVRSNLSHVTTYDRLVRKGSPILLLTTVHQFCFIYLHLKKNVCTIFPKHTSFMCIHVKTSILVKFLY